MKTAEHMVLRDYHIFDKMIEGVQIIGKNWEYLYVNDAVAVHGKYKRHELLGRTMTECYPGIENTLMFVNLRRCMEEDIPLQMINEFDFPDGSKGFFDLRMQPVEEGVVILSNDITAKKNAELFLLKTNAELDEKVRIRTAELIAKNKELEQFNYIASHDLQEPLRTVSNYISILHEDYGKKFDNTALSYLKSIDSAVNRMSLLVKSLLDFSRLGLEKELQNVDIGELIRDVISDLNSKIGSTETRITIGDMPRMNVFETEIRQLFQNLISNAIKFRRKDRAAEIDIRSERMGGYWKFSIRDNGIGIAPAHHNRIFNIFQRLHLNNMYEGSGIGLATCKKIAALHGGDIWVDSAPGEGSTFYFTLIPLHYEQKAELHPAD
jgi:signal transduction histidine kinase